MTENSKTFFRPTLSKLHLRDILAAIMFMCKLVRLLSQQWFKGHVPSQSQQWFKGPVPSQLCNASGCHK